MLNFNFHSTSSSVFLINKFPQAIDKLKNTLKIKKWTRAITSHTLFTTTTIYQIVEFGTYTDTNAI